MKSLTLSCAFCIVLFAGLLTPSHAAEAGFSKWCGKYDYDVNYPLAWPQVKEDVTRLLGENDPGGAYDVVVQGFQNIVGLLGGGDAKTKRALNAFNYYLGQIQVPGNETPAVWDPTQIPGSGFLIYQLPKDPDISLPDNPLQIPCSTFQAEASPSYDQAISYALDAMKRVGSDDTLKVAQRTAYAEANRTYLSYERMLFEGLPMWPWEMWLNGKLIPDNFSQPAPLYQLAFFRPNVSPALKFDGVEDSDLDYGFTLEPIGYVSYTDSSYKSWWGVSSLVTVTDDNGIGYGALARWDQFTLGIAHHEKDDDTLMYVSIDLYKYILGEEGRSNSAQTFLSGVKGKLLKGSGN